MRFWIKKTTDSIFAIDVKLGISNSIHFPASVFDLW